MNPAGDDIPLLTEVVSVGRGAAPRTPQAEEAGTSLACLGEQMQALIDSTLSAAAATLRNELASRIAALQRTLPTPIEAAPPRPAIRLVDLTGSVPAPAAESVESGAPGSGAAEADPVAQGEAMEKTYSPAAIEQRWYQRWEAGGYFAPQASGPSYCILLPPPNVTGSLHMGHAFQDTLMDCLVRYHRMRGDNTLWQCGTDHAGIATQMVVERQLAERGESREQLGRDAFVAAVWQWKEQSGGTISRQLRRMGSAMDWSRERFTLDPGPSRAVTDAFVRLYHEGLIYRGQRLVNWDPVLHTAISDLEVVASEERGQLWEIRYPLDHGEGHVVVATTRPETMLGDSAVAVHPEDERYRHLIGRRVQLPLTGRTIPIIADPYVDPAFGTGCLKITPAHDFDDYEVGLRHGLPALNIFTPEARINDQAPEAYRGMDRFDARQQVLRDLEDLGLLASVREHTLMVPRGDRSNAVVEPYLTDQWYVRIAPLAAPAIRAVAEGRIRFVPEGWSKTYFEWMRNIKDWCISRQLWWGHRIPAWYDGEGNIYVGRDEQEARKLYRLDPDLALTQDADVLDTWFSSALWPLSTLGWPDETPDLSTFYPTSVLVTGFDIIFFWVARMIMMGLKFTGEVPFREVYIHGLVRDADGQKMSKSKGNILDPLDLIDGIDLEGLVAKRTAGLMQPELAPRIEKATRRQFPQGIQGYGTDALRYTFASLATQGRDIRFDLDRIEGYRNFCNKLWNATRYVRMATEGRPVDTDPEYGLGERWIRARLQQAIRDVAQALAEYRFDLAAQALYEMIRDEYCDWYIEWSKVVLTQTGHQGLKAGAQRTLLEVLEQLLRLAHPLIPFITEELWQGVAPRLGLQTESILLAAYPEVEETALDPQAEEAFAWVKRFALAVRRIRAEWDIAPSVRLKVFYTHGLDHEQGWLDLHTDTLCGLLRIETIERLEGEPAADMSTALAGHMTVLVPLAGVIDREAEIQRLEGEMDKLAQERQRCESKLANAGFMARAPAEVVTKEQGHFQDISNAVTRLREQRARLEAMAGALASGASPTPAEFTGEG